MLIDAIPSGSYVAISHVTLDFVPPHLAATAAPVTKQSQIDMSFRTRDQFAALTAWSWSRRESAR
jgi:hypothetical protein